MRNLHPHSEMGERPGRRRGLQRVWSPPWDPASPLPRGSLGCGLSRELEGAEGKEEKGAAREEPPESEPPTPGSAGRPERHLRPRRGTERDAGERRAGGRGLSRLDRSPATKGQVHPGWQIQPAYCRWERTPAGPSKGQPSLEPGLGGKTGLATPKLDGEAPESRRFPGWLVGGRVGGWAAGREFRPPLASAPFGPILWIRPVPRRAALPPDKGSKGVAPPAVFHPRLVGLWHFKGQVGRALGGVLAVPLIPGEGRGGTSPAVPRGPGSTSTFPHAFTPLQPPNAPAFPWWQPHTTTGHQACSPGVEGDQSEGGLRQNQGKLGNI